MPKDIESEVSLKLESDLILVTGQERRAQTFAILECCVLVPTYWTKNYKRQKESLIFPHMGLGNLNL